MGRVENRGMELNDERRMLAAAFSHDLRTSLAVLQGYMDLLELNVPRGEYSQARLLEVVGAMSRQVGRLGSYVEDMSALQRLEDMACKRRELDLSELASDLRQAGDVLCGKRAVAFQLSASLAEGRRRLASTMRPSADAELVMEVFENLVSNGARFAYEKVGARVGVEKALGAGGEVLEYLTVMVTDDGPGFGEEALREAVKPFYSQEMGCEGHLGLGLHICSLLCQKHGGRLIVGNAKSGGGQVRASFLLGKEYGNFLAG